MSAERKIPANQRTAQILESGSDAQYAGLLMDMSLASASRVVRPFVVAVPFAIYGVMQGVDPRFVIGITLTMALAFSEANRVDVLVRSVILSKFRKI